MHAARGGAADQQRQCQPFRCNSPAKNAISSSEGVIRPDRPTMSAFSAFTVSTILAAAPSRRGRSPHNCCIWSTMPTMFFRCRGRRPSPFVVRLARGTDRDLHCAGATGITQASASEDTRRSTTRVFHLRRSTAGLPFSPAAITDSLNWHSGAQGPRLPAYSTRALAPTSLRSAHLDVAKSMLAARAEGLVATEPTLMAALQRRSQHASPLRFVATDEPPCGPCHCRVSAVSRKCYSCRWAMPSPSRTPCALSRTSSSPPLPTPF